MSKLQNGNPSTRRRTAPGRVEGKRKDFPVLGHTAVLKSCAKGPTTAQKRSGIGQEGEGPTKATPAPGPEEHTEPLCHLQLSQGQGNPCSSGAEWPKPERPPAPFPSCLLPPNHRDAARLERAADVLHPVLSACFPQNHGGRQKPQVTLLHSSIPA